MNLRQVLKRALAIALLLQLPIAIMLNRGLISLVAGGDIYVIVLRTFIVVLTLTLLTFIIDMGYRVGKLCVHARLWSSRYSLTFNKQGKRISGLRFFDEFVVLPELAELSKRVGKLSSYVKRQGFPWKIIEISVSGDEAAAHISLSRLKTGTSHSLTLHWIVTRKHRIQYRLTLDQLLLDLDEDETGDWSVVFDELEQVYPLSYLFYSGIAVSAFTRKSGWYREYEELLPFLERIVEFIEEKRRGTLATTWAVKKIRLNKTYYGKLLTTLVLDPWGSGTKVMFHIKNHADVTCDFGADSFVIQKDQFLTQSFLSTLNLGIHKVIEDIIENRRSFLYDQLSIVPSWEGWKQQTLFVIKREKRAFIPKVVLEAFCFKRTICRYGTRLTFSLRVSLTLFACMTEPNSIIFLDSNGIRVCVMHLAAGDVYFTVPVLEIPLEYEMQICADKQDWTRTQVFRIKIQQLLPDVHVEKNEDPYMRSLKVYFLKGWCNNKKLQAVLKLCDSFP